MSVSKEEVIEYLKNISVIELSGLVKELEEIFGVSAAAPVVAAAVVAEAGGAAAAAAPAEEQTEFTLQLTDIGAQKINVIKEVRTIVAGLGLKEAKELVEGVASGPQVVKEGLSKEEAEKFQKQLEAVGAKVQIK
jgi:large subunit ribosomal protein L7/L12